MNKRALSLPILISLVVGNMIGTGIYVLPASLSQYGTISLLAWVYTSLGALFLALTFSHLSKRFPKTGGPYTYAKGAFGPLVGSIVAYTYWLSNVVSIAAISVASVSYLGFISPTLNSNSDLYQPHLALALEIGAVWFFTLINIAGIHFAGVVQVIITLLKVAPLVLISIVGLAYLHLDNLSQFKLGTESSYLAISSAATLTFWAFIGLETATVPAENTKGSKDIYKATMIGTVLTSVIYIASTFVLMGMIPVTTLQHSQFPFAEGASLIFGKSSALLISLCALVSGLGALNACILIQGQIVFAAARDGLLPRIFSKLSKNDAPIAGQIFSSSIITFFLILTLEPSLLKQFNEIALLATLLTLVTYLIVSLGEVKLSLTHHTHLKKKLYSRSLIIATIATLYAIWMISNFEASMIIYGILLLIIPIPIYFILVE